MECVDRSLSLQSLIHFAFFVHWFIPNPNHVKNMNEKTFQAFVVEEAANGAFKRVIKTRNISDLPDGEVLIRVSYSSLNYKDALSAVGNKGVTKNYPHTPGVDAAGVVEQSENTDFKPGDEVLVTGYDLGMNTDGGFGQYIRVPAGWIVKLPQNLSLMESMMYGTAGFTAALALYRMIQNGLKPENGEVVVTGASGGVGSISVGLLNQNGFSVVAATGKTGEKEYFKSIGAQYVIHRDELNDQSGRLLLKSRWAGGIDTVGGHMLATLLQSTKLWGSVAACGNAASYDLNTNVYPFILRGVSLLGIDSGNCPMSIREKIWNLLAGKWKLKNLKSIVHECILEELDPEIDKILSGGQRGRVVVNLES